MQMYANIELGFSPILGLVSDGSARECVQVVGWTGGFGSAPSTGMYVGSNGYVAALSDAVNIKGSNGADGAGINIQVGTDILNTGTAVFSNANGVSFGLSGSTITASVIAGAAQTSLSFSNDNGVSFGIIGSTITATVKTDYLTTAQPPGAYLTTAMQSNAGSNFVNTSQSSLFQQTSAMSNYQTTGNYLTTAMQSNRGTDFVQANAVFAGTNASGTIASDGISISVNSGGAGGAALKGSGIYTQNTGTVEFANSNGITFGLSNNGTMTASHNGLTTAMASNAGSNFIGLNSALTGNGVSATINSSGISLNVPAFLTTAQPVGDYLTTARASNDGIGLNTALTGNGVAWTVNSSGISLNVPAFLTTAMASNASTNFAGIGSAITNGTMTFGTGGLSLNLSNHLTTARASTDAIGLNTALTANGVSMTANSSGLSLNFPAFLTTADLSANSSKYIHNWKLTGNTAGTTSSAQGTDLWLAGGNGVTISGSSNTLSFSVATNYQSQGAYLTTAMLSNASTAFAGIGSAITNGTMTFGTGGLSLNLSNHLTTARASTDAIGLNTAQSNVTWTVNSSGLSFDARGYAGTGTSATNASITLNSNGLAISVAAPGAAVESNWHNLLGANTAGNTTASGSTIGLSGLNLTLSGTNASQIVISAPAVSSLSGTGQVSISVNGSTISIGVPNAGTYSGFNPYADLQIAPGQAGHGSIQIDPQKFPNVQFDRVLLPVFMTNATNSSGSHSLSFYVGLYTKNASTMSLYASQSTSFALTNSGTAGNYSLYSGFRNVQMNWTTTITEGQYWIAIMSKTTSGGANGSYSFGFGSNLNSNFNGFFGSAQNTTMQATLGQGVMSVTSAAMPNSIAFTDVRGSDSQALRAGMIGFASSTI